MLKTLNIFSIRYFEEKGGLSCNASTVTILLQMITKMEAGIDKEKPSRVFISVHLKKKLDFIQPPHLRTRREDTTAVISPSNAHFNSL